MGERAAEKEFDDDVLSIETTTEPDPLPENCHYRDEGCELSGSCLNCPFDECVYDRPGGRQRWRREERAAKIARLFTTEGKSLKELADMFGVCRRTIQRDLKLAFYNENGREING